MQGNELVWLIAGIGIGLALAMLLLAILAAFERPRRAPAQVLAAAPMAQPLDDVIVATAPPRDPEPAQQSDAPPEHAPPPPLAAAPAKPTGPVSVEALFAEAFSTERPAPTDYRPFGPPLSAPREPPAKS